MADAKRYAGEPRGDVPSPLAPWQQGGRRDAEAIKRQGWQEQRVLVVAESDGRLSEAERADVRRIGEKLYGA